MHSKRPVALISVVAVLVCAFAYVSIFYAPSEKIPLGWSVLAFGGIFVNIVSIYFAEFPNAVRGRVTWRQLHRDTPKWGSNCEIALGVLAVAHFLWLLKLTGGGATAIIDGQFVLDSHGQILRVLTESEYFAIRGLWLRCFAFGYGAMYVSIALYWFFRDNQKTASSVA